MVLIPGDQVTLRAFEPSEADTVWRWRQDPAVCRWLENRHPESSAAFSDRFEAITRPSYERLDLAIETLDGHELVGLVGLRGAEPEIGDAELALYLGETGHWGRGLGTDATRTICRYGFDVMRLHKVWLSVFPQNVAARRVYEKVGFVEEGRLREGYLADGVRHDRVLMGLLADELRHADG